MSTSKSILIVATALCLATLVYGFDPAKPKPSETFQASYFTMGSIGFNFVRGYYDGVNKILRTDFFNQKGEKTAIYIGFYNLGKLYSINVTTNDCESMKTPAWSDPFAFLNDANYVGTKSLPDGKLCDAWETDYGFGSTAVTCWRGNDLMLQTIEAKNMGPVNTYTTDYESTIDAGVFDLPKSCNSKNEKLFFNKRAVREMNTVFPLNMH
eukprot:TRINITY_DN4725_c0_g1_i1.p1 TRINITY_DN4725_c0_g1~~TRINITY_DN4725_c0_g1_i1.p1  ORF type:complete len:210 (-),score=60.04 TRINITY_DN4725_c0_g1_i1:43-672(-)